MFPSLQSPSFHPLSSALSLSVPPVAIRTCPRTLDICTDRSPPVLDSPDITMKTCADGRESGTNAPVGPLRRLLGQVHKVPATGAVVMGAVVTGAGEPVPIFQIADFSRGSPRRFFRSPIFQIADFSEARITDFSDRRFGRISTPAKKNPSKKISARNRPKSQRIFEFTNFYFIF